MEKSERQAGRRRRGKDGRWRKKTWEEVLKQQTWYWQEGDRKWSLVFVAEAWEGGRGKNEVRYVRRGHEGGCGFLFGIVIYFYSACWYFLIYIHVLMRHDYHLVTGVGKTSHFGVHMVRHRQRPPEGMAPQDQKSGDGAV